MKNRSELREIIMRVLYQVSIYEETKVKYNVDDLIHEALDIENSFVNETVYGVIENKSKIINLANK